jgi:hypothetical protein
MGIFLETNEYLIIAALLITFLAATEIGFRSGRSRQSREDEQTRFHITSLQGPLLGLLALMLGFTFSMALSRYDMRKELVLAESNAIGTAYLRARLMPEPHRSENVRLLNAYVDARLDFYNAGNDPVRLAAAKADAAHLQQQLWAMAIAMSQLDTRSVPLGLFVQSLNAVFDLDADRSQALQNHVPKPVLALVSIIAAVALAFIGHGCGLHGRRHFVSTALVALLLALVLAVILDLDLPRQGLIKIKQDSMISLQREIFRQAGP